MIVTREMCKVCGKKTDFVIEDGAVLLREAKCSCCGASIRNSDIAGEILQYIGEEEGGLINHLSALSQYKILNACSSGYIHNVLKNLENYTCCEFFEKVPVGEYYEGVLCVDLCNIPFEDNFFDIIITEDVFEHIRGYEAAFKEIYRVLKPNGAHVFTVPIHDGRKTIDREGRNKIYHGDPINEEGCLVITDWGDDIKEILEKYKYQVEIKRNHIFYSEEEITDVDRTYDEYLEKKKQLNFYLKYNSIVIVAKKDRFEIVEEQVSKIEKYSIEELKERLGNAEKKIVDLNRVIRNKNDDIRELNDDNERRGKHILELDKEAGKTGELIRKMQEEEQERNNHIKKLDAVIAENIEKLKEAEKQIEEFSSRLQEKDKENNSCKETIAEMQQTIRNKEGHIELLLEVERAYEREKRTHAYKFAKRLQKLGNFLLPPNSRRRFFLRIIFNVFKNPKLMFHVINPTRIKNYLKYMKKEGMEGVKVRYEEAVAIERMRTNPESKLDLEYVEVKKEKSKEKNFKIEDFEKITFQNWKNPTVSIIIPVYNEFQYTYNCLKSIYKNSGNVAYEIIIANDCSTDITNEIEKIAKNVQLVTTKENVRFLLNCNNAAKYAKGKYILFLNNDTQVQENWLQPLVDLIESNDTIGMVGSKLVYPDGLLQEAGGIVWKDASAWNYGNRKNPEDPEFNYVKEADYISGASIMIKASLWNEIGGFDERFVPAYYEDTDLAFEVRKRGYKVMYQPLSVVVHFEGISNGTDIESGLKHYQQVNFEKFYEKWKEELQTHEVNAENVFTAKDRSNHKKHILVVDHYVPHHDQDAGGKCTYMYLKLFVKMGFKVTFIGDNFFKHEPYTTELNQMGIEVLYGNYYYNNWEEWLKENSHYFDYVYLQRPHIAVKYIDLVKKYSNAKILYFAHDLHHIREYREYEMTKDPARLESSEHWKEIEYDLFNKTDVGHVVGSYEQEIMQKAFPDKPIRNIPLYIYDEILTDINKNFMERQDLLYVGGFGHPPNADAVLWFAKEVYPKIVEKYPTIKWHVVGGKVPKEIMELASENIIIEGFVSDEDLEKLYRTCRMAVVPLRFGAGVKGKVVEAAYFQIPLVTTSIGAEGLSRAEGSMVVEDDGKRMAEIICEMYENYTELKKMSDAGVGFIQKYFTKEEAERVILLDVEKSRNEF